MAARLLIEQGRRVVLHARNERRGEEALAAVPGAETVVTGDLASITPLKLNATRVASKSRRRAGPEGAEGH
jgi:NAD(P)-dependent dehydrogenase (short-subunit alcohol dehydrogenase family)